MSYFLSNLKQRGYLEQLSITVGIIGSRKLSNFKEQIDIGKGWDIFSPNLTIYGFDADRIACEQMNSALASQGINWSEKHFPVALWNSTNESEIYITRDPGCISLHRPSEEYRKRFTSNVKAMELISTEVIKTITLDSFCKAEAIDEIDVLQIDVQGGELQVLEGATEIIGISTLAIVAEVEFMELYVGQPLFGDVDAHLRKQGFTLLDLANIQRDQRRDIPIASGYHPGPLSWADSFYFRDLISNRFNTSLKTPSTILKLACIADVMNFPDYALEILEYLTVNYGSNKQYNFAEVIIESLSQIPQLLALPEIVEKGFESLPIIAKMRNYI
uniref:FkbM family methyltransferase n=1 Tax=Trichocoleus desertorum TaxID=1481672 RepID=UPI0025B54FD2|nr:FkbM family methyltransferase [Trichocoleus desertorum]